jgi:hypothetical protein
LLRNGRSTADLELLRSNSIELLSSCARLPALHSGTDALQIADAKPAEAD